MRQSVSRMCCWVRAGSFQAFRGSSPITTSSPSRKHTRSQGPSLRRRYPASSVDPVRLPPCPPPHATLELRAPTETGLPRLLVPPAQRAELTTPTDRAGACVDCFPVPRGLPRISGGSASTTSLSRPAQASLALRPASLLAHHAWALLRGFDPTSHPIESLVSYQVLPTTTWVGLSPTSDLRRWGALRKAG